MDLDLKEIISEQRPEQGAETYIQFVSLQEKYISKKSST